MAKLLAARQAASARRVMIGFLLRCLAYWGVALLLVGWIPAVEVTGIDLTVRTLQAVYGLLGMPVERFGSAVYVAGTSVAIVSDCSPHMPYLMFAAVVLAFPAPWQRRLWGVAAGAVLIHAFNTLRIVALIGVLAWKRPWFEFVHVYLFQTGTVLVVFATFALWLKTLTPPPRPA
jgi:exosortase/archaeosortase family protein